MLKLTCRNKIIQWFGSNSNSAKRLAYFEIFAKVKVKEGHDERQQAPSLTRLGLTAQSILSSSAVLYAGNTATKKTMAGQVKKSDMIMTFFKGMSFIIKTSQNHARHFKFQIGDSDSAISKGDLEHECGSSSPERSSKLFDSTAGTDPDPTSMGSKLEPTVGLPLKTTTMPKIISDALQSVDTNFEFFSAFNFDHSDTVSSILRADQNLKKELLSMLAEDELMRCYVHDQGVFKLKGFFIPCKETMKHKLELTVVRERFSALNFRMMRRDRRGGIFELIPTAMSPEKYCLLPSVTSRPPFHPLYISGTTKNYNSVYHRYEDALSILNQNLDIPEVVQLLDIAQEYTDTRLSVDDQQCRLKHPFIVIEGLDATGKSTLTENLSELLGACQLRTPPDPIRNLRRTFDALPEMIRRAYYSLGNYVVAKQVATKCQEGPVIMDRFWHSTTAYAIANDCDYGDITNLPPIGHWVYQWPSDLLKPTVVLLLSVTEKIREERMAGRNEVLTWEEKLLSAKAGLFRKKLLEAYRRMSDPPCAEIDAGVSREEVAARSREALKNAGVI